MTSVPESRSRSGQRSLGDFLARARERAGLSIRALAREMGVSPATVLEAERGRNPRASTLEAYLRALPGVSPHALLQAATDCAPSVSPAAWSHYRDLHGFSASRLELSATLSKGGELTRTMVVKGLRSHRSSLREDRVELTLLLGCVTFASPAVLRSLRPLEEEKLGRRHLIEDGAVRHEYTFPAALDRHGVGYRRIETGGTPADSELTPMPFDCGTRLDVRFPVASLSTSWSFEGEVPSGIRPAAWLRHQAVRPGDEDLLPQLHPGGLPLRWRRGRRTCVLEVEKPLVGTCYGLGWSAGR